MVDSKQSEHLLTMLKPWFQDLDISTNDINDVDR